MQLSILIATNRSGLLACSRIAQACSWAGPGVEVIIRDNSGDARKRELLHQFRNDNCRVLIAEPCDASTNFSEALKHAKGEFVFLLADDDFGFDQAIAVLPKAIDQIGHDQSIVGITGAYVLESSAGSAIVNYKNIDANDVVQRVAGYLNQTGPNVLFYAPIRREIFQRIFSFTGTLPFSFSFHDQIACLLYLLNGRFVPLNRLLYLYEVGPWQAAETAQKRDLEYYKAAGLDPAINKLHWFLCAFEGAVLVRNSNTFPPIAPAQRQSMADLWFSAMYRRFSAQPRYTFDSALADQTEKLCAKLRIATGQLSFHDMLAEISGLIALVSRERAEIYFGFWDAILNKREVVPRDAAHGLAAAGKVVPGFKIPRSTDRKLAAVAAE